MSDLITFIEEQVIKEQVEEEIPINNSVIEEAKKAGKSIGQWIEDAFTLNESFFDGSSSYFVPIPIALVAVI
ncbi:hypothetical protein FRE64_00650 [Euhalothece natronophila Z-M001]|uniref:Uncharacterized protein n=1 Tax=Euhalothece natronophila Z-M001 TaxID=522448 RepID=A0A5B8NHB4_9CHRO|nr:hypothetical protein [Euhalothece natronophila]QDZ38583.1 hypothetical protein FRE64_00650 [Euhalothece natronophila Z-M001]